MTHLQRLEVLENRLLRGEVPLDELPMNLEPLLLETAIDSQGEKEVRKIMNDLELVLFTLPQDTQLKSAEEILERAKQFLLRHQSAEF